VWRGLEVKGIAQECKHSPYVFRPLTSTAPEKDTQALCNRYKNMSTRPGTEALRAEKRGFILLAGKKKKKKKVNLPLKKKKERAHTASRTGQNRPHGQAWWG